MGLLSQRRACSSSRITDLSKFSADPQLNKKTQTLRV